MSKIKRLALAIPAMVLATLIDVFIASIVAGAVFLQVVNNASDHRWMQQLACLFIGVCVYAWLVYGHIVRGHIKGLEGEIDEK